MKENLFLFEAAFLKDNYVFVEHGLDKGTIYPSLRLVPSGNLFLALNRRHHCLLKKVRIL